MEIPPSGLKRKEQVKNKKLRVTGNSRHTSFLQFGKRNVPRTFCLKSSSVLKMVEPAEQAD